MSGAGGHVNDGAAVRIKHSRQRGTDPLYAPMRFTSILRRQAAGSLDARGPIGSITPALLSRMAGGPNRCSVSATIFSTEG